MATTLPERVTAFLQAQKPHAYCDFCIARATDPKRFLFLRRIRAKDDPATDIQGVTMTLGVSHGYKHGQGVCHSGTACVGTGHWPRNESVTRAL